MSSGKTSKEIMFELSPYIFSGVMDDDSNYSSPSLDDEDGNGGEKFVGIFNLSIFRTELMVLAVEGFPGEYAIKNSLGQKYKIFVQKQWNMSTWLEVANTEVLY